MTNKQDDTPSLDALIAELRRDASEQLYPNGKTASLFNENLPHQWQILESYLRLLDALELAREQGRSANTAYWEKLRRHDIAQAKNDRLDAQLAAALRGDKEAGKP